MAFLMAGLEWVAAALEAAAGEAAAAEAAAAEAAATAETAAAASEAAAAAEAAAEAAATAEAAAGEAATLESKAGLEAVVKAEAEAVKAAEKAAGVEVGLGARIGAELGARIETGLKAALGLLKAKSGDLLLLYVAVEQIPTAYRKVLAGWAMTLAAGGIKLALVAFNYMGLSGSEEGKKIAKEAQEIIDELHEKARKLTEDSPASKVQINKETHAPVMEKIKKHADSTKQEMGKMTDILEGLNHLMKEHAGGEAGDNHPIK